MFESTAKYCISHVYTSQEDYALIGGPPNLVLRGWRLICRIDTTERAKTKVMDVMKRIYFVNYITFHFEEKTVSGKKFGRRKWIIDTSIEVRDN